MRSRAAIGNHPIHPMIVPIPIGAFTLALLGDILHTVSPEDPFWYEFSYACIGVGVLFALFAAVAGAIDYFGVRMSAKAFRIATVHALLNLTVVALYGVSLLLRRNDAAMGEDRWPYAFGLAALGFVLLGVSGWLGGKLAYEHRVGVIEAPESPQDARTARAAS
jgi:uncharacterized membrane protein